MLQILIYPNHNLHFLVHVAAAKNRIVVRSFATQDRPTMTTARDAWVMPASDVAAAFSAPVSPVAVTRATPAGACLRLCDLPGYHAVAPGVSPDTLLNEVSQTALVADAALLGRGACSERADWVVFADSNGQLYAPVNRTLTSHAARAPKAAIYGALQRNAVLNVLMPFADADFSRAAIYVNASPAYGLVYDAASACAIEAGGLSVGGLPSRSADDPPFRWPDLRLNVPVQLAADSFAEIAVQLVDGHSGQPLDETGPQVHLESHEGYLPKRRIKLVNGSGTARIGALGLSPGDRLHLKAGWRYYPGLAEAEITIV